MTNRMLQMDACINVVVRNTFLHLSRDEDDETSSNNRSSSAPPRCRHEKPCDDSLDSASVSTGLSSCGDLDDKQSLSRPSSEHGEDEGCPTPEKLLPAEAQQQLEQMSQEIMGLWAKLRAVEAKKNASTTTNSTQSHCAADTVQPAMCTWAFVPAVQLPAVLPAVQLPTAQPLARTPLTACKKLDVKAPLFTPSCRPSDGAAGLVASIKELLMLAPGVVSVEVQSGSVGTLTTISIKLDSTIAAVDSVKYAAKMVFLDAAANSESVYVLGYAAEPFTDLNESVFATMFATLPRSWECSACWDTYQYGTCQRGKSCKKWHPGKTELHPVRVTVAVV